MIDVSPALPGFGMLYIWDKIPWSWLQGSAKCDDPLLYWGHSLDISSTERSWHISSRSMVWTFGLRRHASTSFDHGARLSISTKNFRKSLLFRSLIAMVLTRKVVGWFRFDDLSIVNVSCIFWGWHCVTDHILLLMQEIFQSCCVDDASTTHSGLRWLIEGRITSKILSHPSLMQLLFLQNNCSLVSVP